MTQLTTRISKQDSTKQAFMYKDTLNLLAWTIYLLISAIHSLGMFALKQGGRVELQLGPLTYRIFGCKKNKE